MRPPNRLTSVVTLAAVAAFSGPALCPGDAAAQMSPGEYQVAQAFNEIMTPMGDGGSSSSGSLSPDQVAIVEPYWALRNQALLDLDGMVTPNEYYEEVETEWDPVCQEVFDAFAVMRAGLKALVPEGQELDPFIAASLETEQEGFITLCFDGSEIAFAHNRLLGYAVWLDYEIGVARDVQERLAEEADYILLTITDLNDAFEEASFAVERLEKGEGLSSADERALASFEDYYNELQSLKSSLYRLHFVVLARRAAYIAFHERSLSVKAAADEMISSVPEEIEEPVDVADTYQEWLDTYRDSTERTFDNVLLAYEWTTESLRDGSFFGTLDAAEGLPSYVAIDSLIPLYESITKKSQPIIAAIREHEDG